MPESSRVPRLTHVLFDLDGTISDSQPGISASLRTAFAEVGLDDPGDAALLTLIGPPFEVGLPRLGVTPEQVAAITGAYRSSYEVGRLFDTALYPGIIDMLDELAALGLTPAVATAKPELTAVRIVEHFGIADRFATVAGATYEVDGPKARRTKTAVITETLLRLGIDADEPDTATRVVMVGDRDHDVDGAIANGISCLGAGWGYGSVDELTGAGAVEVCATPADVVAYVRERI